MLYHIKGKPFFLLIFFLFGFTTEHQEEISRIESLGYKIPPTEYQESSNPGYDLVLNIVYLPTNEYDIETWMNIYSRNKNKHQYFSSAIRNEDGLIRSQTRHEIGHVIEYQNNIFKDGRWFEILNQIDVKKEITEYASTNPREAFAEAFSMYTSPYYGTKIRRLPKIIEDYIESLK